MLTLSMPWPGRAWQTQKQTYLKAGALWAGSEVREVVIPHRHAAGRDGSEIPLFVRVPTGGGAGVAPSARKNGGKVPAVLLMTGLDGYRPDNTARSDMFVKQGW